MKKPYESYQTIRKASIRKIGVPEGEARKMGSDIYIKK